jgi:Amt family ammonium transporter
MIKYKRRKLSLNGFCAGAIAGLVAITPASGYVQPHYAIIFGLLAGSICLLACDIKRLTKFRYDDTVDAFAGISTSIDIKF